MTRTEQTTFITVIEPCGRMIVNMVSGDCSAAIKHVLPDFELHVFAKWTMLIQRDVSGSSYNHLASVVSGRSVKGRAVLISSTKVDIQDCNNDGSLTDGFNRG